MALPLVGFLVGGVFGRFLTVVFGALIGKIIIAMGITIVTFTGITIAINGLKSAFDSTINGAPADMIAILQMGGFINSLNMMLAAMVAVSTVRTVSGTLKQIRVS